MKNEKNVFLKCDCHAETAVFTSFDWNHGDIDYELSIEDAYCCGDYMGIKGRFKRAWRAFWDKPVVYNAIYVQDKERMKKFLNECFKLMGADIEPVVHAKWELAEDGDGVVCSHCHTDFCTLIHCANEFYRCPHCGAIMDMKSLDEALGD